MFHFHLIIYYEGWESEYREAITDIFSVIDPAQWHGSVWALPFPPHLREIVRRQFPKSRVLGRFVPAYYGKLRYFRPIREEIYRKMKSWIREAAPQVFVYLCMKTALSGNGVSAKRPPTQLTCPIRWTCLYS